MSPVSLFLVLALLLGAGASAVYLGRSLHEAEELQRSLRVMQARNEATDKALTSLEAARQDALEKEEAREKRLQDAERLPSSERFGAYDRLLDSIEADRGGQSAP